MNDKKQIEENNLDGLINGLFLENNPETIIEHAAHFIFQQEYNVKIDSVREKKLIKRLEKKLKGHGGLGNFATVIFVVLISSAVIFCYDRLSVPATEINQKIVYTNDITTVNKKGTTDIRMSTGLSKKNTAINPNPIIDSVPVKEEKLQEQSTIKLTSSGVSIYYPLSGVGSESVATFFKPTEEEFIFFGKAKTMLIEKFLDQDKETVTKIASGEMQYKGNRCTIYQFSMSNQAITNLEYKIFLADLMKSEKFDELKIATVKNETWVNYGNNILATTYFFDPAYNDFPVVNIAPKAALAFCKWLEKEMNLYAHQKDPFSDPAEIRLPFDSEWLFASGKGEIPIPDCNGYNTIYDIKDEIVDIDYLNRIRHTKKRTKNKQGMTLEDLFSINRYGMEENQTLQLFAKALNYTDSVYFSRKNVFSKAAHVSEMVLQQETNNILVVGSCWKNKQEYNKMLKEFNKESASPFIGFRIVILND